MTSSILRTIGFVLTLAAVVLLVLNLPSVADAGTFWIGIPLLIVGAVCVAAAKKGGKK
jgi:hypothetical protein